MVALTKSVQRQNKSNTKASTPSPPQSQAMKNGLSFGASTPKEIEIAEFIKGLVPSVELIRFVNSGTEATMSAIRVARGFTGKNAVIKFDGCYHGHADHLLVKAGSGAATCGHPSSAGVPESFSQHTLVARFNDIESVKNIFEQNDSVACVIVEPIIGNMGCVPPRETFLKELQGLCRQHKALLIFDEVMTGFRVSAGGAQQLFDIKPDLTCFGKIIGGGLPVGAFGGRRDVMEKLAPLGPVYQAGTLSGNPLAMTVGLKTLELLGRSGVYEALEHKGQFLEAGLRDVAKTAGVPLVINRVGSMFSFFFTEQAVQNADDVRACDSDTFVKVFRYLLEHGVYLAPSAFEAGFISLAHEEADLVETIHVFRDALHSL